MDSAPDLTIDLELFLNAKRIKQLGGAVGEIRPMVGSTPWQSRSDDFGVGKNTLRAFRNLPSKPSVVYRSWAGSICEELIPSALLSRVHSSKAFEEWHTRLAKELTQHWHLTVNVELTIAQKYKLVDLFIKWLSEYDHGDPAITEGLAAHAHCALDRQTLTAMNQCLSNAIPLHEPRMGHIKTQECYDFCQTLVRYISLCCNATPLLFDYAIWKSGS